MQTQYREVHITAELTALRDALELLLECKFKGDGDAMYDHLMQAAEDEDVAEAYDSAMCLLFDH
jgi:hypothetical protein